MALYRFKSLAVASELVCAQKNDFFFTDYISFKKLSLAGEKVNSSSISQTPKREQVF